MVKMWMTAENRDPLHLVGTSFMLLLFFHSLQLKGFIGAIIGVTNYLIVLTYVANHMTQCGFSYFRAKTGVAIF